MAQPSLADTHSAARSLPNNINNPVEVFRFNLYLFGRMHFSDERRWRFRFENCPMGHAWLGDQDSRTAALPRHTAQLAASPCIYLCELSVPHQKAFRSRGISQRVCIMRTTAGPILLSRRNGELVKQVCAFETNEVRPNLMPFSHHFLLCRILQFTAHPTISQRQNSCIISSIKTKPP